jgi:hypothetical protein
MRQRIGVVGPCTVVGEQTSAVSRDDAVPVARKTLLVARVISCTASATAEFGTSTMTSTPSASIQRRAMLAPTSDLLRLSAETTSIFLPNTVPPKSATAICAAATEPGPELSV